MSASPPLDEFSAHAVSIPDFSLQDTTDAADLPLVFYSELAALRAARQ